MPGPSDTSLNLVWVLSASFLVMFMQVGFAMLETGLVREKNAVNTMAMNLVVYLVGILGFWLVGYAVYAGGVSAWPTLGGSSSGAHELGITLAGRKFGLLGASKFALLDAQGDAAALAMFLFATVFMDTAATIPTGPLAERWKFSAFFVYALFMSMVLYPVYANWVWGGGWLATLGTNLHMGHGHVDFAGASVVHMTGGLAALAGTIVLGPRLGKFRHDGTISAIPGHNLPMAVIGTLILAFGWFGFNAGSSLAGNDPRVAQIAVNTMIASAGGGVSTLLFVWQRHSKPDIGMACNGMIGGLVAITGPCAFVSSTSALLIGIVAGLVVYGVVMLLERRLRIDDPVGAVAAHAGCGSWGALALGLFADGSYGTGWNGVEGPVRGALFGDPQQLVAQIVGVGTNFVWAFGASYLFFRIVDRTLGNRVSAETESSGLDEDEMGADAYPAG